MKKCHSWIKNSNSLLSFAISKDNKSPIRYGKVPLVSQLIEIRFTSGACPSRVVLGPMAFGRRHPKKKIRFTYSVRNVAATGCSNCNKVSIRICQFRHLSAEPMNLLLVEKSRTNWASCQLINSFQHRKLLWLAASPWSVITCPGLSVSCYFYISLISSHCVLSWLVVWILGRVICFLVFMRGCFVILIQIAYGLRI
jgi:hypothetical protein